MMVEKASGTMSDPGNTLRVMQAVLTLERGGAQEMVRTLALSLKERGCAVTVCAFEDGPLRADLQELGVPVELLSRPRFRVVLFPLFLLEMLRIRRDLAQVLVAHHVDVLQTHMLQVLDFLTLGLRRAAGVDVILWTFHSVEFLPSRLHGEPLWLHRLKRAGYRLGYRLLSGCADGFVAVSDGVRRALLSQVGPRPDRVFTIHNGVDLEPFARPGNKKALCSALGVAARSTLIATVGRLVEAKGHRYLIGAVRPVLSRFPQVHFLLIGNGDLRTELEEQAAHLGVVGHVHFLGTRKDVADLLAAADLFVLPSLWEGLPMALLEAMAAAKPIVATAAVGTDGTVIPGQTGLIVPPGDSQALAEGISRLLREPARAQAMGQAARKHVEGTFSAEQNAAEHMGLYRRLLKSEAGP
jgi:glycosyltransferase involved in cell wall biosynthesis